eukprot:6956087-Prymnesium_polylepis.1
MKPVSGKIARRAIGAPSTVKLRGCERSEQQRVVFSAHLWRQKSKKSPETCAPRGPASSLRGSPRPPPGGGGSSQGGVWTPPWRWWIISGGGLDPPWRWSSYFRWPPLPGFEGFGV